MEQIRAFIAIELPAELKLELDRLQAQLKSGVALPVKWVEPGNIHLTLKFLGNINANKVGEITSAMEEAARTVSPFHIEVKGLGVFPNLNRVQVVWAGLKGDIDKLTRLQRNIESNLAESGFTPEKRAFSSHLTLARVRNHACLDERQSLGRLITSTGFEAVHAIEVIAVSLMKSQLTRDGAIYSRLNQVKL